MYRSNIVRLSRHYCNVANEAVVAMEESVHVNDPRVLNKSRLLPKDRNALLEQMPYENPQSWVHLTEKYQRKMIGRHGVNSGLNPRICFPIQEDMANQATYDRLAEPKTFPELLAELDRDSADKMDAIQKRENDISKKLEKLEQWKQELNAKLAKKEADALAAKVRKERLIEEVRRHFGYKVDPRDERFKEMLEQKEREDKKKQKEAKRKAKEEKMLAKLLDKKTITSIAR